ncbi:MAG: phage major tail tube protein [Crocinitomicaceae bacterium]|nr:phage major tail tube protein [Crocinitomicaceae bacterium]|tara:strand:- start:7818 stop:8324 length:507 start_codon:yes stop_codon:yes gene_type:complete
MLPRTLRNFSLFVDGTGYAGKVTEMTLPTLAIQTEDYRAGGLDAPIAIDMGMESMSASFTLAEYDVNVLKLFGLYDQNAVDLTVRGALQRNGDTDAVAMVVNLTGSFSQFDPGSLEAGAMTEASFEFAVRYYKLSIAAEVLHEVDIENMTRVINGTDQLQSLRTAMGV